MPSRSLVIALFACSVLLIVGTLRAETLQDAWKAAFEEDHSLKAAQKDVDVARESLASTKTSRLPHVITDTSYTVLSSDITSTIRVPVLGQAPLAISDNHFLLSQTSIGVPLYTGGRIQHGIDAASSQLAATQADQSRLELDTKLSVANAYIAVLRTRRLLAVAESSVNSLASYSKDVSNFYELGVVSLNDQLAAEVALADARQRRVQAQNAVSLAEAAYNRAVGRSMDAPVNIEEIPVEPVEDSLPSLVSRAVRQRPELKEYTEESNAARSLSYSTRAEMGPQIGFRGGYNFLQNRFLDQEGVWSATVGVEWSIFDFGEKRHKAKSLLAKSDALQQEGENAKSLIALEVRKAWLDIEEARQRIHVAQQVITQANENLKVSKDRYAEGIGTNTEVLDAETLRVRSLSNEANATYDAVTATMQLRRATGDL